MVCENCKGEGEIGGCPLCGETKYYDSEETIDVAKNKLPQAEIPTWYKSHGWDVTKAGKKDDTAAVSKILTVLNQMVQTSASGTLPTASYMFLLPHDHGKRFALFTMIMNYQRCGVTVAPVVDIATFNLLSSRNRYEDQELLLSLFRSDIAFIYGTEFITRKLTAQIFKGLASSRALNSKPTILFAGHSYKELSDWCSEDKQTLQTNLVHEDHLSTPYILDGVVRRASK